MAPVFNTTVVCNATASCASALNKVQERLEDSQRLSYILGALLGIVFLLFVASPLIFNLPKERDDDDLTMDRAPPPPPPSENNGIEMEDLEGRELPSPNRFDVGSDDEESPNATRSTFPDPSRFRSVTLDGEDFHINKSEATLLAETGIFHGAAGGERELARCCVEEARTPSTAGDGGWPRRHIPRGENWDCGVVVL